jgi:GNAT superfamily N-acetyltransferase
MHTVREINPASSEEIALVASRMRNTLEEVLGEEKGQALYTMEWLEDRVRWHLDSEKRSAKIYLSENTKKEITGHAIARIEQDESGKNYGFFSTIFVEPTERKQGVARSLLKKVEDWCLEKKMPEIVYYTAETNAPLIELFTKNGFHLAQKEAEMVRLVKPLRLK